MQKWKIIVPCSIVLVLGTILTLWKLEYFTTNQKLCESLFFDIDSKLKEIETLCTTITQNQFNLLFPSTESVQKDYEIKKSANILNKFPSARKMLKAQFANKPKRNLKWEISSQGSTVDIESFQDWQNAKVELK